MSKRTINLKPGQVARLKIGDEVVFRVGFADRDPEDGSVTILADCDTHQLHGLAMDRRASRELDQLEGP